MNKTFNRFFSTLLLACILPFAAGAAAKTWTLVSPDGRIKAEVSASGKVTYSVTFDGKVVLAPSEISMTLGDGTVFGSGKVTKSLTFKNNETIPAVAYKKATVKDVYNALVLTFKDCLVEFRAYDNAVAYRFLSKARKTDYMIESE